MVLSCLALYRGSGDDGGEDQIDSKLTRMRSEEDVPIDNRFNQRDTLSKVRARHLSGELKQELKKTDNKI